MEPSQAIDSVDIQPFHIALIILNFLIIALDGFDTGAIGYVGPALVAAFGAQKSALGPVFSAALLGAAAGALIAGPLADRFGRKTILVASIMVSGLFTLASAFADGIGSLTVLRLMTGLGLGAVIPGALTLIAEFSPRRRRSLIVNLVFCGFPVGLSLGGLLAAWLIPAFGWRSVLAFGGGATLLLGALSAFSLPESLPFLVMRGALSAARKIAARIDQEQAAKADEFFTNMVPQTVKKLSLRVILSRPYLPGTLALWATYFLGLVVGYLLVNWMPMILKDAGFTISQAALLTALYPLGGALGALASGWLMDRRAPQLVVAGAFAVSGLLLIAIGQALGQPVLLSLLLLLAGVTMNGGQSSTGPLATNYYPPAARATGVSWMLGIGRFGAICGTMIGAQTMRLGMRFETIFSLLSLVAFLAAGALVVLYFSEDR